MGLDAWLGLIITNLLASLIPGQNVALVTAATARGGSWCGSAALAGVLAADMLWTVLALLTIAGLLDLTAAGIEELEIYGGVALTIIGLHTIREKACSGTGAEIRAIGSLGRTAALGAFVGFANPIALVFFLAVLPQFIPAGGASTADGVLCVVAIVLSSALALVPYLAGAHLVARRLSAVMKNASGLALALLGGVIVAGKLA